MKFKIDKASDWSYKGEVEINTLEELIDFVKKEGDIVFTEESITIYDDYLK